VFQEADQGTLFLDEIGELPLGLQPRLLRALEVGAVRPVGATREQRVQARVIAATHVDLEDAVRTGRFREDLYYRLCGDVLRTPPLRERPEDIGELAERMLADEGAGAALERDALTTLTAYAWPGNVRELRNVLRRAAVLAGPTIHAADLALRPAPPTSSVSVGETLHIADRSFLDLEREILTRALQRSGGNKRAAAHALGIPKSTLCDKAKRYGIG
jgi:DNA-binding NtrC family response regulator